MIFGFDFGFYFLPQKKLANGQLEPQKAQKDLDKWWWNPAESNQQGSTETENPRSGVNPTNLLPYEQEGLEFGQQSEFDNGGN